MENSTKNGTSGGKPRFFGLTLRALLAAAGGAGAAAVAVLALSVYGTAAESAAMENRAAAAAVAFPASGQALETAAAGLIGSLSLPDIAPAAGAQDSSYR